MASNISNTTTTSTGGIERRVTPSIHYNISYLVQGAELGTDGAIVLLHDIPTGAFVWKDIMPQLAGLGRAVYAFDMLGFGQSAHPWPADTSNWGQADVLSYLIKSLGLTNIVLVGHGFGGSVAQILATRLLRLETQALVLIDTLCYLYAFPENWPLPNMTNRQDFDAAQHTTVEDMIRDLQATLPEAVVNKGSFNAFMNSYVQPWDSELGKELLYQQIRLLLPNYTNSVSSDLHRMSQPVLILWGNEDQQVPVEYADRLNRDIPNSQLVIVPDAGHYVLFDAPGAVADAINGFIKGL